MAVRFSVWFPLLSVLEEELEDDEDPELDVDEELEDDEESEDEELDVDESAEDELEDADAEELESALASELEELDDDETEAVLPLLICSIAFSSRRLCVEDSFPVSTITSSHESML